MGAFIEFSERCNPTCTWLEPFGEDNIFLESGILSRLPDINTSDIQESCSQGASNGSRGVNKQGETKRRRWAEKKGEKETRHWRLVCWSQEGHMPDLVNSVLFLPVQIHYRLEWGPVLGL
jgi:hypothetical protein